MVVSYNQLIVNNTFICCTYFGLLVLELAKREVDSQQAVENLKVIIGTF